MLLAVIVIVIVAEWRRLGDTAFVTSLAGVIHDRQLVAASADRRLVDGEQRLLTHRPAMAAKCPGPPLLTSSSTEGCAPTPTGFGSGAFADCSGPGMTRLCQRSGWLWMTRHGVCERWRSMSSLTTRSATSLPTLPMAETTESPGFERPPVERSRT